MVNRVTKLFWRQPVYIAVLFIAILFFLWLTFGNFSLSHPSINRRYLSQVYSFSGDTKIAQDFTATYPGLYRIDVYFKKDKDVDSKTQVIFHLKKTCKDTGDLEKIVLEVTDISDQNFHPFIFSPIKNSAGQRYCMLLEAFPPSFSNDLGLYANPVDTYPEGTAQLYPPLPPEKDDDSKPTFLPKYRVWLPIIVNAVGLNPSSDLWFQPYYWGKPIPVLQILFTRLSANKPFFFGSAGFYPFLFGFYFVGLILLWITVSKTDLGSPH